MMRQLLEILRQYRFIDRAILFLRLFVGTLIALHIIDKLQTYNFVLTGYPALLFESSWATFVIFTLLEAIFAVMIILGFGTRFAAFIMALGMFVEIFIVYPSLGWLGVERQILYIGIYVYLEYKDRKNNVLFTINQRKYEVLAYFLCRNPLYLK